MRQPGEIRVQSKTNLRRNVKAHGYRIRAVHIPGDGNCLFHAVEDQLKFLRVPGHTHKSLRELAVRKLQDNMEDNHLSIDLAAVALKNDAHAYLQDMSRDGTWGGHPELVALSHALQKTIIIITSSASTEGAFHVIGQFTGHPILLGLLSEYHYMSLEPLQFQNYDDQGSMKASEFETRDPHSAVSGRNKGTRPRPPVTVPKHHDKESGNPSLNDDVTTFSYGYGFQQKENESLCQDDLLSVVVEKQLEIAKLWNVYKNLLQHSKFQEQVIRGQKKQISELHSDSSTIHKENEELRAEREELLKENKKLRGELSSQSRPSVEFGDDASCSMGSNKVETGEPSGSSGTRQRDSDGSSEEEFVDALSEAGTTL